MKLRLLATALVLCVFSQATIAATFNDVNTNTPYADSIYWTVNNGITEGYGNGNWGPDVCVTRAELVKMVLEYMSIDYGVTASKQSNSFTDINKSDWFYDYVLAAKAYGIVEGYEDDTFRPNICVNRVEAMKIALTSLMPYQEDNSGEPLYYDDKTIVDMSHASWYSKYARPMFENRIVGTVHTQSVPNPQNTSVRLIKFFPEGDMTRKEVAYMIEQISKVYPSLGCTTSGGSFNSGNATCDCSKVDGGLGNYNEEAGYCENAMGDPAGDLNAIFRQQML